METKQEGKRSNRKSDRVLDPGYCDNLQNLPEDQLKARRDESVELEHELSYSRRLLQGKIDIQKHALQARRSGDKTSLEAVIAALPSILADDGPAAPASRNSPVAPSAAPDGRRAADRLAGFVADLEKMSAEDLSDSIERLGAAEKDTSESRKQVQGVIDRLSQELVRRLRNEGAARSGGSESAGSGKSAE